MKERWARQYTKANWRYMRRSGRREERKDRGSIGWCRNRIRTQAAKTNRAWGKNTRKGTAVSKLGAVMIDAITRNEREGEASQKGREMV